MQLGGPRRHPVASVARRQINDCWVTLRVLLTIQKQDLLRAMTVRNAPRSRGCFNGNDLGGLGRLFRRSVSRSRVRRSQAQARMKQVPG